ncbi:MAG: hypothetical protein KDH15_13730 [Rhodocyclaceae bacterium]|nr:hypothetical protein [Rhodocyclaceae bacterium]
MKPLFDRNMLHVGWLDGDHVFDVDIVWRAFVSGGHLYCAANREWRGSRHGSALLDPAGLIVAWHEGEPPRAARRPSPAAMPAVPVGPFRPKRPIAPRRPLFPQTPVEEWSALRWQQWLMPAPPAAATDEGETVEGEAAEGEAAAGEPPDGD